MAEERVLDTRLRLAAVEYVKRVGTNGVLTSEDLRAGFAIGGARIPLINPQRGIFKPKEKRFLLSVRTVFPASGRKVWYDDQREVHQQIERGEELVDYAFYEGQSGSRGQSLAPGGAGRANSDHLLPGCGAGPLHGDLADLRCGLVAAGAQSKTSVRRAREQDNGLVAARRTGAKIRIAPRATTAASSYVP